MSLTADSPEILSVAEVPDPQDGPNEVVIRVAATAVNRADLLQLRGSTRRRSV